MPCTRPPSRSSDTARAARMNTSRCEHDRCSACVRVCRVPPVTLMAQQPACVDAFVGELKQLAAATPGGIKRPSDCKAVIARVSELLAAFAGRRSEWLTPDMLQCDPVKVRHGTHRDALVGSSCGHPPTSGSVLCCRASRRTSCTTSRTQLWPSSSSRGCPADSCHRTTTGAGLW
jgi:hypothetical protein